MASICIEKTANNRPDKMKIIRISAPGKVILFGEHAVVYGKLAVAGALNIRTLATLTFLTDTESTDPAAAVKLVLEDLPDTRIWSESDVSTIREKLKSSPENVEIVCDFLGYSLEDSSTKELAVLAALYLVVALSLEEKCGGKNSAGINETEMIPENLLKGVEIKVNSFLPIGAGLGSSAAYSVCLAAVLLTHFKIIPPPSIRTGNTADLAEQDSNDENRDIIFLTWGKHDLDLINKWAYRAERIIHGKPSGIDNTVSTYGGVVCFQDGQIELKEFDLTLRLLLTNTNVSRSTKRLVETVRRKRDENADIYDLILSAIDSISRKSLEILETSDSCENLEQFIDLNQKLLEALGVSHPSISKICEITSRYNLSSKLTGAGGGGCVITLLPDTAGPEVVADICGEMNQLGFECHVTDLSRFGVQREL